MKMNKKLTKRFLAVALSLVVALTTVFAGTPVTANAAAKTSITSYTSVKAGNTVNYTIKNLQKGQYAKVTFSGTAKGNILVKKGTSKLTSGKTKIVGTGKNIGLTVKTTETAVGRNYVLKVSTYNSKTNKRVSTTATKSVFVYKNCTALKLDKETADVKTTETVTLTAAKTPANATQKITWTTSDKAIATVTNGVVTGVAAGKATITATCGTGKATCEITVTAKEAVMQSVAATGAKQLTVTFDSTVNYAKADFVVKKANATPAISEVKADGKTAVITLGSKMTEGTYAVEVKGVTKEVTVKDETLTTLSVVGTNLAETVKIGAGSPAATTASAEIAYQVLNQYGERMMQPGTLTATCTFGATAVENAASTRADGVLQVTGIPATLAVMGTTGSIVLVDSVTGIHSTTTIAYSAAATLSTVKVIGTYNTNTLKYEDITAEDTISNYVIVFEGQNQYGAKMDAAQIIGEGTKLALTATPILTNVKTKAAGTPANGPFDASNLTEVTIDGTKYPALVLDSANVDTTAKAGTLSLTLVNTTKGILTTESFKIQEGTVVKTISVSAKDTIYAEDSNILDYEVLGTDGKAITKYADLSRLVKFSNEAEFKWAKKADGTAALVYKPAATGYTSNQNKLSQLRTVTVTANSGANIVITTKTFTVYTERKPVAVTGVKGTTACTIGGKVGISLSGFVIEDQYSNAMTSAQKYYPSSDSIYFLVSDVTGGAFDAVTTPAKLSTIYNGGNYKHEFQSKAEGTAVVYVGFGKTGMTKATADCSFSIAAVNAAKATDVKVKYVNWGYDVPVETNAKTSGLTAGDVYVEGNVGGKLVRIPTSQIVVTGDTFAPITSLDGKTTKTAKIEVTVETMSGTTPVSTVLTADYNYSNKDAVLSYVDKRVNVYLDADTTFATTFSDTVINASDLFKGLYTEDQYGSEGNCNVTGIKYTVVPVSVAGDGSGAYCNVTVKNNNTNGVTVTGIKGKKVILNVVATYGDMTAEQTLTFTFKGGPSLSAQIAADRAALLNLDLATQFADQAAAEAFIKATAANNTFTTVTWNAAATGKVATVTFKDTSTLTLTFTCTYGASVSTLAEAKAAVAAMDLGVLYKDEAALTAAIGLVGGAPTVGGVANVTSVAYTAVAGNSNSVSAVVTYSDTTASAALVFTNVALSATAITAEKLAITALVGTAYPTEAAAELAIKAAAGTVVKVVWSAAGTNGKSAKASITFQDNKAATDFTFTNITKPASSIAADTAAVKAMTLSTPYSTKALAEAAIKAAAVKGTVKAVTFGTFAGTAVTVTITFADDTTAVLDFTAITEA